MTYFPKTKVEYSDSHNIDAFGKLRVSSHTNVFDSKQILDKDPDFWCELLSGSGTSSVHTASLAQTVMTVPASNGACAIRQTKMRFNYTPGVSSLFYMSGRAPPEANTIKRIGYFSSLTTAPYDPFDGIFFQMYGSVPSWNIALTGGIKSVPQSQWNLDKLDGTGPSNISASYDNGQIWTFDFEWLGMGRVRCGQVIGGEFIYCHEFLHGNIEKNVYMGSPNLPLRYEIRSTGGAGSMTHICSAIMSEGGSKSLGSYHSVSTKNTHVDANTIGTVYALCGIRLATESFVAQIEPSNMSLLALTNDAFQWKLLLNPVLTGSVNWVDHDGYEKAKVQEFSGSGQTITIANSGLGSGHVILQGYASAQISDYLSIESELRIGVDITGSRDTMVLAVVPFTSNADIHGAFTWRELI